MQHAMKGHAGEHGGGEREERGLQRDEGCDRRPRAEPDQAPADAEQRGAAEQARIVALLAERVDIGTDGLNVRLRVDGLASLAREILADGIGAAA